MDKPTYAELEAEVARLREENTRLRGRCAGLKLLIPRDLNDTAYYWEMVARQQRQFKDEARQWARYYKRTLLTFMRLTGKKIETKGGKTYWISGGNHER